MTLHAFTTQQDFDAWHDDVKTLFGMPIVGVNAATGLPAPEKQQTTAYTLPSIQFADGTTIALVEDDLPNTPPPIQDWASGQAVAIGDLRIFNQPKESIGDVTHNVWICVQAHTTQEDWTPPVVPNLWNYDRIPDSNEWMPWIAVTINEEMTYLGLTYRCLQSHTTQPGWEPPNVPALWELVL